jgi:hypothetical protein
MIDNNEYDAIGELFRKRLENHRIAVDDNGWDKIERRIGKRKNLAVVWLLRAGSMAAAAAVAALMIISKPNGKNGETLEIGKIGEIGETGEMVETVEMENGEPRLDEVASLRLDEVALCPKYPDRLNLSAYNERGTTSSEHAATPSKRVAQKFDDSVTQLFNDSVTQFFDDSVIAKKETPKLDDSLMADWAEEDDDTKKTNKWLLAAAFGIGGNTDGFSGDFGGNPDNVSSTHGVSYPKKGLSGRDNDYAAEIAANVPSFSDMSRNEFADISHRPPLSFGLTARKNLGKRIGVESGLTYTYLASHFKWSNHDARQGLHYLGIPVNMAVYVWNSNANWQIYLSGGFMVEKGLRGIYRQERQMTSEHRFTTVKSSIDGLQWSLNGGFGVNYRLDKNFGIYFEPRVGYSFDCNQPVSIRTEYPVYFGVSLGLNFEL